jgi:hypothetical protein
MKVGDLVESYGGVYLGVIIESRVMVAARGMTTELAELRGKNVNSHQVYWGNTPLGKNPVWVKERDLVRAV